MIDFLIGFTVTFAVCWYVFKYLLMYLNGEWPLLPAQRLFTSNAAYKLDGVRHGFSYIAVRVFVRRKFLPGWKLVFTDAGNAMCEKASPLTVLQHFKDAIERYENLEAEKDMVKSAIQANHDKYAPRKDPNWIEVQSTTEAKFKSLN